MANFAAVADIIDVSFDIEKLREQLNSIEKEFDKAKGSIEGGSKEIGSNLEKGTKKGAAGMKSVKKETDIASKSMTNLTSGVRRLATTFAAAFGAAQLIRKVTTTVMAYDDANARLNATLGKTRQETEKLRKQQQRLGSSTQFTAAEVAKAQTELGKLGSTLGEITQQTGPVLFLAASAGVELADAATVAASTLNAFGLQAGETQRVVDVMAKSFTTTSLDFNKFRTALGTVGANAKQAGVDLESLTAMMGTLTDSGFEASTSATMLRNIFLSVAKEGRSLEDVFSQIRNATDQTNEALKFFDSRAVGVAITLANSTEKVNELTKAFKGADGSAEDMARTAKDTLTGDLEQLNSAFEGLILSINETNGGLSQFIRSMVQGSTAILQTTDDLNRLGETIDRSWWETIFDAPGRFISGTTNKLLKLQNSTRVWGESAEEAIAKGNWRGAADDIGFLEDKLAGLTKGSDSYKVVQKELKRVQKLYNDSLREQIGLNVDLVAGIDDVVEAQEGIITVLRQQKEAIEAQIEGAQSLGEINRLSEKREQIETRINSLLNARKNLIDDGVDSEIEADQFFENFVRRIDREKEIRQELADSVDEIMRAEIDATIQKNQIQVEWEEWKAQRTRELAEQTLQAQVEAMQNFSEASAMAFGENAASTKALASFSAILYAYQAILNVLANVPAPANIPLAVSIGAKAFAQVARINSQTVPSFYEGTDFVRRNGAPIGRDTISAKLHEGEAVIPSKRNKQYPGLTTSLIKGDFDKYVTVNHVMPALKAQKRAMQEESAALTAQAMKGTFVAALQDERIVNAVKKGNYLQAELLRAAKKSARRRNPYRK